MAITQQDTDIDFAHRFTQRFSNYPNILGWRIVDMKKLTLERWPSGDLIHVRIRRKQQRSPRGYRNSRQRIRPVIGTKIRTFERIDRNVNLFAATSQFLTDKEHRRFITLSFSDDDAPGEVDVVKGDTHGFGRCRISRNLIASSVPLGGFNGGKLCHLNTLHNQLDVHGCSLLSVTFPATPENDDVPYIWYSFLK
jgi:hypothetical protein